MEERQNWRIALHFGRQEYEECRTVIEEALEESHGLCEYALQVKGMLLRLEGKHLESLWEFQAATRLNPLSPSNVKQVAYGLLTLEEYAASADLFEKTIRLIEARFADDETERDWRIWHNCGICYVRLKEFEKAVAKFESAKKVEPKEVTFAQLALVLKQQRKYKKALRIYQEALDYTPDSPDLLTSVGLCYLRLSDHQRAFEFLGNALTYDPRHFGAILAAGSIIQDNGDFDVALHKYRVAAVAEPNCPELWNNVGLALLEKQKIPAAVSCLEKANDHAPMEWIIAFNLAVAYANFTLFFRAFHYFQVVVRVNTHFVPALLYMAVCQAILEDATKARLHFRKVLALLDPTEEKNADEQREPPPPENAYVGLSAGAERSDELRLVAHLNYAIFLFNEGDLDDATQQRKEVDAILQRIKDEDPDGGLSSVDPDVLDRASALEARLTPYNSPFFFPVDDDDQQQEATVPAEPDADDEAP